jgi:pimeloyl-ACP methyl ester carboxylesterase
VKDEIEARRHRNDGEPELGFVTHRTMADLRWFDLSIDPNQRKLGESFTGDPRLANNGPAGFARFSTLRSWLSQWSVDDSRANAVECVKNIHVPFLAIENGADDGAPASHMHAVYEAAVSKDRTLHRIDGANHYYVRQPELLDESCRQMVSWLTGRGLL